MILAIGFRSNGENYEFSGDVAKLKKASKVIETAIEPMQVARMTPEEKAKH